MRTIFPSNLKEFALHESVVREYTSSRLTPKRNVYTSPEIWDMASLSGSHASEENYLDVKSQHSSRSCLEPAKENAANIFASLNSVSVVISQSVLDNISATVVSIAISFASLVKALSEREGIKASQISIVSFIDPEETAPHIVVEIELPLNRRQSSAFEKVIGPVIEMWMSHLSDTERDMFAGRVSLEIKQAR